MVGSVFSFLELITVSCHLASTCGPAMKVLVNARKEITCRASCLVAVFLH